ncbi:MAG: glycosyltransferase [Candidatus Levybacteria bacterium]|nr:glycosyltransferase [Candidatus Levybacteria bacterium]
MNKIIDNKRVKLNRICMINPQGFVEYPAPLGRSDTGGQILYVIELAKAIATKGIKVDIITRQFDDHPEEEKINDFVKIVRIPCGPKGFVAKEKLYESMPEFAENFMAYIEKTRKTYDLIHSHYWDGGYAGNILKKLLDIPHIHTPHTLGKMKKIEMAAEETHPTKLKPIYRYHLRIAIEQKIMTQADAVLVLCETTRIQILQHYIVDFEKIHVIFPGVDTSIFTTTKNAFDKQIKLEKNAILTVSRLVPAKGLDRVVESLSQIKNKVPFHLYIAGGESNTMSDEEKQTEEQLNTLIKKFKLEKKVTRLGKIDHTTTLPAYYRAASAFILGARYEPFGLTTLEAMACGAAPIISSVAGSREVIIDGLNGFIVNMHDRTSLSEAIVKLISDDKLRKKVAENAAFTTKEHSDWDKVVEKMISLYLNLL